MIHIELRDVIARLSLFLLRLLNELKRRLHKHMIILRVLNVDYQCPITVMLCKII
jgi:hypothetical protein